MIELYMPQAASEDVLRDLVQQAVAQLAASSGVKPTPREMGAVMKLAQQQVLATGLRADGKLLSELVKSELAK